MPNTDRRADGRWGAGLRRRAGIALATVSAGSALLLGGGLATAPAASAQAASAPRTAAVVVKVAVRGKFGKILTTVKGLSLYIKPTGGCTGSCLAVWPPLLMPKGTTTPEGIKGLGTVKVAGGRLQVTYNKHALYTFVNDKGSSVNGNGVGGFLVAKVS